MYSYIYVYTYMKFRIYVYSLVSFHSCCSCSFLSVILPSRNNFLKGHFHHAISSFSPAIALQKCASEFCSYCIPSGGSFFLTQGKSWLFMISRFPQRILFSFTPKPLHLVSLCLKVHPVPTPHLACSHSANAAFFGKPYPLPEAWLGAPPLCCHGRLCLRLPCTYHCIISVNLPVLVCP